jgi:hypothetical protein
MNTLSIVDIFNSEHTQGFKFLQIIHFTTEKKNLLNITFSRVKERIINCMK